MAVTANVLETADGLKYLAPAPAAAWIGILEAHAELTRALDSELSRRHGLTMSSYEALAHLAHAPGGHLRMSDLAQKAKLSISRVSRLIDHFEDRGYAARRSCAGDSRVVHVTITPEGRELFAGAQETYFRLVEDRFLSRLDPEEVGRLGELLARLLHAPLGATCPGASG